MLTRRLITKCGRAYCTLKALPFKITRQQANNIFITQPNFLEPSNNISGLIVSNGDPVKECLIPFHSADINNIYSSYVAEYGIDRTEYYWVPVYDGKRIRIQQQSRVVTDWYRVSGNIYATNYAFGEKWSQIYAGFVYPRILIEDILPLTSTDQLQNLTKDMLMTGSGKRTVYPHEMTMALALEKINSHLQEKEDKRVRKYLLRKHSADHVKILTLDMNLQDADIKLYSYFVPAYIYQSALTDMSKYKIVNGFTGELKQNRIYSILKSTVLGSTLGAVASLGLIMTNPYLIPVQILGRIIICSSVTGMISGLTAKYRNLRNDNNYKCQKETDQTANTEYIETEDDITRRKFTASINEESVIKNNIVWSASLIDKLRLLQLNPDYDITLDVLHTAFHKQMKKWHPDLHINKKNIAEEMSKQITEAYRELNKKLKE